LVSHAWDVLARLSPALPAEQLERAARWSSTGAAVEPRASASVVLLRETAAGLETYLLHRHARMPFAPSMVVFPGGGVDEVDRRDELDEVVACACRETLEETGVSVSAGDLLPWAHWITPEFEPRRYNTFFFVAELPTGQRARDLSGETERAAWTSPAEALASHRAGELMMLPPTVSILIELSEAGTLAALRELAAGRVIETVLPRLVEHPEGWRFCYPEVSDEH
jgi:8-oxo-dGTP pyrophosphatase MutT (NUDIX family)